MKTPTIDDFKDEFFNSIYFKTMYLELGDLLNIDLMKLVKPQSDYEKYAHDLYFFSGRIIEIVEDLILPLKFISNCTKPKKISKGEYYIYHYNVWLGNTIALRDNIYYLIDHAYGLKLNKMAIKKNNIVKKQITRY